MFSFFKSFIICLILTTVTSEIIAYIAEEDDVEALLILRHLNISRMYHSGKLNVDDIFMEHTVIKNTTSSDELRILINNASLLISVCKSKEGQQLIARLSQLIGIPTIHINRSSWNLLNDKTSEEVSKNQISLIPTPTVFNNAILDILPNLNITPNTSILFDCTYDVESVQELFRWLPVQTNYVQIEQDPAKRQHQLEKIFSCKHVIIIVAETALADVIVKELSRTEVSPILTVLTKDITPFLCEECPSLNLFWIRPYATGKASIMRALREFLVDSEINSKYNYFIKSSEEVEVSFYFHVMGFAFKTLMNEENRLSKPLSSKPTNTDYVFEDVLKALNRPVPQYGAFERLGDSTFYENMRVKVIRVMRTSYHPEQTYNKEIASWTMLTNLTILYDSLDVNVQTIKEYRIATTLLPPFVQISENPKKPYEGYCIDLIELIREELNFTYTIYEVEDGSFGSVDQNGNWNGLIAALMSGSADIALAPLTVNAERENVIDFTVPYYDLVGTTILMRKPDVEHSLFRFTKVLKWPVWLCTVAAYILMSIALWLFNRFSPYSYTNNRRKYLDYGNVRSFTFRECLWFCMTSLTPQGGGEAPKNVSGMIAAATWWIFGIIITASYTANLAAFLTLSRLGPSITSLDDLAAQYRIKYAPHKGSPAEAYFKQMAEVEQRFHGIWKQMSLNKSLSRTDRARLALADYPIANKFTNMWRCMQRSKLPSNIDEAVRRVLDPKEEFAFIGDATYIKYMTYTNCELQQVGTEFSRKPYAIAVQSGHELRDRISSAILVLLNQRRLETLKEKWWEDNPKRAMCADTGDESDGITVQNIGGVFIFILAGLVLSVIALTIECIYHRKTNAQIVEIDKHAEERKETNGTSAAPRDHHDNRKNSLSHNNHITSYGIDNAGFQN